MLAYLDCFSGISGDMLLGALLDAGLDLEALRAGLASLPLSGYHLEAERIVEHAIAGTRVHVRLDAATEQPQRHLAEITALIDASALPPRAATRAQAIFHRLAQAEAAIHATSIEQVHFHEVGAIDSIVDIVGVALGLELLGIDDVYCSELPLTSGRVVAAHGALPVPAPATLEVLRGSGAIWRSVPAEGELVTPTGAAIVATLAEFARPTLAVTSIGYGFGTRPMPWANCLRLMLGTAPRVPPQRSLERRHNLPPHGHVHEQRETEPGALDAPESVGEVAGFEHDEVVTIESNIDNMTGEALGWLLERLLAEGALDVGYLPLHMKKNRPGTLLTVLAHPDDAPRLAALVVRESATLGVRLTHAQRVKAERRSAVIETPLGSAQVKLKLIGGVPVSVSPEYDDCRALAARLGLPVEVVAERVTAAARAHYGLVDDRPAADERP